MRVTAIIAAGGARTAVRRRRPKQLLSSAAGRSWSAASRVRSRTRRSTTIVVVVPAGLAAERRATHVGATARPLTIVAGGARRQDSVANAFASVDRCAPTIVLIHDAARPFVSADHRAHDRRGRRARRRDRGGARSSDTVKRVERASATARSSSRRCRATTIFLAQTPQAFRRDVLREPWRSDARRRRDRRSVARRTRRAPGAGRRRATRRTEDHDGGRSRARARRRAARRPASATRVGTGYDLHRLVEGRPLILGGVTIPSERGALGAFGRRRRLPRGRPTPSSARPALGDIGRHFPDTDPHGRTREPRPAARARRARRATRASRSATSTSP